jgi:signal transduction histidine kinase/ActR/RegA family two-component response regulator
MRFSFRSGLGFKAAVSIAVPMLVILAISGVVSGVVAYRTANSQLENAVRNTVADDIGLIKEYLWQLDIRAVQSKLDAYVKFGQITGAMIADKSGLSIQAGTLGQDPSAFIVKYSLEYPQINGPVQLGVLTLEASRDPTWALARGRVIQLIAVAASTALLSIFLIQQLLNFYVLSPIKQIALGLRQRPADWRAFRIDKDHFGATKEIDELVLSIHEMRDQILASQSEISHNQIRLAQAAKLAGLGYATSDQTLDRFQECDENYAEMHGKSVDEMLQLSIDRDIIGGMSHPDELVQRSATKRRITRGQSLSVTGRVRMVGGEYRHIRKIFLAKEIPDGRGDVFDIVAQDVTEMYLIKEQLLQSQKLEAIGKLTGGIAHDFNNILAVISGNLELIRDEAKNEPSIGYLQTALIAVERGATLTQGLLAFARKQTLIPKVIDVSLLVNQSIGLIETSVGAKIKLKILTDKNLWTVKADRAQLEAVLLNLALNARDAMPDGGSLTIGVHNTSLDDNDAAENLDAVVGEYVCISVTDSGEGMSAGTLERAFEPFFTTKDVGQGTGLGLSMAFGFAKQSGGHLKMYSERGQGATVKLYLPRDCTSSDDATTTAVATATTSSGESLKGRHVFLVEDDEGLRKTIAAQIRSLGCIVSSAADGKSALKLARKSPHIDILLSDIILPDAMDGHSVASELTKSFANLAVVFMSGFSDTMKRDEVLLPGKIELLQKPFSAKKLKTALLNGIAAQASIAAR